MVGEGDLLWHRVPADPTAHLRRYPKTDPVDRPGMVSEVMSPYPVVTRPDTDVAEVAEAMIEHDVRSMPAAGAGPLGRLAHRHRRAVRPSER